MRLKRALLLGGATVAVLSVAIATLPPFSILCALFLVNFLLRTIWIKALKTIGAWDPTHARFWPRLPWRPFWRMLVGVGGWKSQNFDSGNRGTEGFASFVTAHAAMWKPGLTPLGRAPIPFFHGMPLIGGSEQIVGEKLERHHIVIGSTRSGKSTYLEGVIALLPDDACALTIDPKGTYTHNLGPAFKAAGRPVFVVDPMNQTPLPSARISFIQQIDEINRRTGQDLTLNLIGAIARAYFPEIKGDKNKYFQLTSKSVWGAILLYIKLTKPNGTELDARDFLCRGFVDEAEGDEKLAERMRWQALADCPDTYVANIGQQCLEAKSKSFLDVISTLKTGTVWLDEPQARAVMSGNDFFLSDLKRDDNNMVVAFAAPTTELRTTFRPLATLFVAFTLKAFELIPGGLKTRTRLYAEELPSWGPAIEGLTESFPMAAGYGLEVTAIAQDIAYLEQSFPGESNSMIGNADIVTFFATNEPSTLKYINEQVLGTRGVLVQGYGEGSKYEERWVMTEGQIGRFLRYGRQNVIVQRANKKPLKLRTLPGYAELPVWRVSPDRDHGETPLRAAFRRWFFADTRLRAAMGVGSYPHSKPAGLALLPATIRALLLSWPRFLIFFGLKVARLTASEKARLSRRRSFLASTPLRWIFRGLRSDQGPSRAVMAERQARALLGIDGPIDPELLERRVQFLVHHMPRAQVLEAQRVLGGR